MSVFPIRLMSSLMIENMFTYLAYLELRNEDKIAISQTWQAMFFNYYSYL